MKMVLVCQQNDAIKITHQWVTPFSTHEANIELHLLNLSDSNYNISIPETLLLVSPQLCRHGNYIRSSLPLRKGGPRCVGFGKEGLGGISEE